MFFARAASLRDRPNSLTASTVMPVRSTGWTANSPRERVVLERVGGVAGLGQVARGEVVGVDDDRRALGQVAEVGLSAAGFIATSTSGASPGVRMSWSAKCTWNDETPGSVPCGARISAGKFGRVDRSLPNDGRLLGEAVAGELHPVAGVAGEPDDDAVELLDLLGHRSIPTSLRTSGWPIPGV